jgi:F-type H+-transporting ATPase subunit gamma
VDPELAQSRLDHVRTVEPILSALRTISLGSWQAALKRRPAAQAYAEQLLSMLPALLPHVHAGRRTRRKKSRPRTQLVVLAVGSERGLCGRFNALVADRAEQHLSEQASAGIEAQLEVLGARASRILQRRGQPIAHSTALPATTLPPFRLARDLAHDWLTRYEERRIDAVDLVYSAYRGAAQYEPVVSRLIPPRLPLNRRDGPDAPWPPIVETDPRRLFVRVVEQWTSVTLYQLLLDSAAAEHSSRYQLMEAATQTAERLTAELTLVIQAARQEAITEEMQQLATGAGLVGEPDSEERT